MKSNNRNKICYSIKLGLILSVSLFGCSENNPEPATPDEPAAFVSLYHSAPDTDGLNIRTSTGQVNEQPIEYLNYSRYLPFFPGERNIKFIEANTDVIALIDTTFNFIPRRRYTVFAANRLTNLEAVLFEDFFPSRQQGKAMVRFIHMSPDAANGWILANENRVFDDIGFKENSNFLAIDSGITTFEWVNTKSQSLISRLDEYRLDAGNYYNIILMGLNTPPDGNTSELRLVAIEL